MRHLFDGLTANQRAELEGIVVELRSINGRLNGLFDGDQLEIIFNAGSEAEKREVKWLIEMINEIDGGTLHQLLHPRVI
jgi:hypothetical protein